MACRVAYQIPGLTQAPTKADLECSQQKYNTLPDDSDQPEIESYVEKLAEIFVRNHAHNIFGLHLAHGHFQLPEKEVLVGIDTAPMLGRWIAPAPIASLDLTNLHGHVFILTDDGFRPYEYQEGCLPDLTNVNTNFFHEIAAFIQEYSLYDLVAFEVLQFPSDMMEVVFGQGTMMLEASYLRGCVPYRQTGWRFTADDAQPRVCQEGKLWHVIREGQHLTLQDEVRSVRDAFVLLQESGALDAGTV